MNNYPLMETPFNYISPINRTKKDADVYFQWFMKEKDKRIELLQQYINQTNAKTIILDKTPESLVALWGWFEDKIEWIDKTTDELKSSLINRPKWMEKYVLNDTKKLTLITMAIGMDISIYYGETIIANNAQMHWGYRCKPKMLDGVNEPIILGYEGNLSCNTLTIIKVLIKKSTREREPKRLYNAYQKELDLI